LGDRIRYFAVPGAVPSVCVGFATAWAGRGDRRPVIAVAVILLLMFIPAHYRLWSQFPIWYHLTLLGARLRFLSATTAR
jgi:hypothetical protein